MAYSASATTTINSSASAVWDALTNLDAVKEYFFGTKMDTDWTIGSPIYFRGSWEGKDYKDKGTVLEFNPEHDLSYTYWSSMGGKPDVPENYMTVRYIVEPEGDATRVTIDQSNVSSQEASDHSAENWKGVLAGMKKYVEGGA